MMEERTADVISENRVRDLDVSQRMGEFVGVTGVEGENLFADLRDDQVRVTNQVIQRLAGALLDNHSTDLQLPQGLLQRIGRDVAALAEDEPCGIRGCLLLVTVLQKNASRQLGRVTFDPNVVPTFEIHLTLHEDKKHWLTPLKNLLRPVLNKYSSETTPNRIAVTPAFQLVKCKLYRSDRRASDEI